MRKLIIASLMAAVAVPSMATAQSRAEIRRDQRELREEQRELQDARRYGDRRDVREERRDVREARQELREDRRDRRRSVYQSPYRDWRYSRVRPGFQLRPLFYSQRYFIANPAQYRLPRAGRFQRWIRYGDDLLLVNVRTGRVIRVYYNRYY